MSVSPDGRRLLRVEARNAQTPIEKKPKWIRNTAITGPEYHDMLNRVHSKGLHTVCEEAGCPNIYECWEDREATFLVGGGTCTRRCDFCMIDHGKGDPVNPDEPASVARTVREMQLRYATVTGVTRDDIADEGVWLYAETVRQIHQLNPDTGVEVLIPDFSGKPDLLAQMWESRPEVLAHNLETVPRIFKRIRPAFNYQLSLDLLTSAHEAGLVTKSNIMMGLGETFDEVVQALELLHNAKCDLVTINQYMRPSEFHHPIERWVKPQEFIELSRIATEEIGMAGVMAGPLVRSSYRAGRIWARAMKHLGREIPANLKHLDQEGASRQEANSVIARIAR